MREEMSKVSSDAQRLVLNFKCSTVSGTKLKYCSVFPAHF